MRSILLLSLIPVLFSCRKEVQPSVDCSAKTNDIFKVKQLLTGTYEWAYTRVSMTGNPDFIETPLSTGLKQSYIFKENKSVEYYENGALKGTDDYVIDYEFKVTTYPSDSATIVIIRDKQTGQRKEFFRPLLCNDSASFYNPYNSIASNRYFTRS